MASRQWWKWVQLSRRLWVRASLYCVIGIVTALAAIWVGPYLPNDLPRKVGAHAVDAILSIIASSMLAVTTFSLSTLVAATSAATSNATPRATSLLLEDSTAQRALSTFLGAFLFSLVGLIALNTQLYGDGGRFVLFIATLCVVALIVVTLLRWIDHLAGLGRVGETISRVENAAAAAYDKHRKNPLLGCKPLESVPDGAIAIHHERIGYLQHLDIGALAPVTEQAGADLFIMRRPGSFCDPATPIAWITLRDQSQVLDTGVIERIRGAFTVGDRRSFDQDPRFGLIALSEIASRALSAAINDPGTVIDVLGALVRVMAKPGDETDADGATSAPEYPRIHLVGISEDDLVDAAFMPIARDGASLIEISIRLQKALSALSHCRRPELAAAARTFAAVAARRSREGLSFEPDRERFETELQQLAPA